MSSLCFSRKFVVLLYKKRGVIYVSTPHRTLEMSIPLDASRQNQRTGHFLHSFVKGHQSWLNSSSGGLLSLKKELLCTSWLILKKLKKPYRGMMSYTDSKWHRPLRIGWTKEFSRWSGDRPTDWFLFPSTHYDMTSVRHWTIINHLLKHRISYLLWDLLKILNENTCP